MGDIGTYYGLLRRVHEILRPQRYLEIGVHRGHSLALVRPGTHTVGVDPEPMVEDPPDNAVIVPAASDDFFASPELFGLLGGPVDLAFVDGLHLYEQALRDVANVERHSSPDGVILIHDCLPIDAETSTREQTSMIWSGDVWKVVVALRRHRQDLTVTTVDVEPTGLAIVSGLDPDNTVLFDRHTEIVDELHDLAFEDLQAAGRSTMLNVVRADWRTVKPLLTNSRDESP
ncbi:MAG: class I SAM-dependent methyltransferase [Acidimicrobiaceae bacterium]|nr:class I SAM-dependent methyltransferase [Acidimicrobiaceae bacterium]MDE0607063.1 class I SAM-dependent methyltransferase [Acidimicrobiaceae bacterium]